MKKNASASAPKSRHGRLAALLTLAGVGLALAYAGADLALAQNAKKAAKQAEKQAAKKAAEKKADDKTSAKKDYSKKSTTVKKDVKPALEGKADFLTLAKTIDQEIAKQLKANEVDASPLCTEEEFIRRVTLDLTGVIPTAEAVKAFLDNKDTNKRAKLVDELLNNPRYGKFLGELWTKQLLNRESANRKLKEEPMHEWLTEKLNGNMHYDKLVYELITASGPQNKNGAVTFFIANPAPEKMTDQITRHFLGVQLQCAQCHNHPFTDYKQTEYWGMAAFYMNVTISANPNKAAKEGTSITVAESTGGKKGKKVKLPMEAKIVPPKFLKAEEPTLAKNETYRPVVATWMTSKTNPYFARAAANKVWFHLIGRGIVNPVDDMHDDNPATHPVLLATLADQMKQNDFDLKYMIRAICASQTYQRSCKPAGNNGDDHELFSHAFVRAMHPEQLFDSIAQVVGVDGSAKEGGKKAGGAKYGPVGMRNKFIDFFTGDDGYKPLEYQAGIPQALMLMNNKQLGNTTKAINQAMKLAKAPEGVIEHLFLSTVSRRPTATELQKMVGHVQKQANPQAGYADVLWALLNTSEFGLNH